MELMDETMDTIQARRGEVLPAKGAQDEEGNLTTGGLRDGDATAAAAPHTVGDDGRQLKTRNVVGDFSLADMRTVNLYCSKLLEEL